MMVRATARLRLLTSAAEAGKTEAGNRKVDCIQKLLIVRLVGIGCIVSLTWNTGHLWLEGFMDS